MFWKTLKDYLELIHLIDVAGSPKAVLKASLDIKLIDGKEHKVFIEMIEDRNLTSHAYNVEIAEEISKDIPHYYRLINKISKSIQSELKDI